MALHLNVCTFNVGFGFHDYENMLSNFPDEKKKLDEALADIQQDTTAYAQEVRDFGKPADAYAQGRQDGLMSKIEKLVAERLAALCDVICLQEVGNMNRHFIKTLQRKGFTIYCADPSSDFFSTAIALRKDKFEEKVENLSIKSKSNIYNKNKPYGQEIASVSTTLRNTPFSLSFTSLHSPGFQLFNEKQTKRYSTDDKQNIEWGVKYIKEALEIAGKPKSRFPVIAGDINNNPHNQPDHFNLMQEAGFTTLEPNAPTNVNCRDHEYRDRKIDYIFVPAKPEQSFLAKAWHWLTGFFISRVEFSNTPAKVLKGFEFTFEGNCSDHQPVALTVRITTQSKILRLWNSIISLFSRRG